MMIRPRKTRAAVAASGVVLALGLAACSSQGGTQGTGGAAGGDVGRADTPRMKVAFIMHSAAGDTFWDIVRKGAEAAATKDNIDLEFVGDGDGPNQANLVQQAIDKKVDGIAVTLAKPDALEANVKEAVAAGIPVVAVNSGADTYARMGALAYFGQEETVAGEAAGARLKADGFKKVLCVIHEQANVSLEARCDGVKATGPQMDKIYVNGADMSNVNTVVTAKLTEDKSIDGVLMLAASYANTATSSVKAAGSTAKVATFDTNAELIPKIKSGEVLWAVDQQPYLQGYLAVDQLWLYKVNGNVIGGGNSVLTGPAFVDKTNVDKVAKFAQAGTR